MRVWKLVAGILSILISVFIGIQSMAAGAVNALEGNGGTSGTVGLICGILILVGGILSLVTSKSKGNGGNIALLIIFGLAGGIGIAGHGNYKDLIIWSIWAFINAIMAYIACFVGRKRATVEKIIDKGQKAKESSKRSVSPKAIRMDSDDTEYYREDEYVMLDVNTAIRNYLKRVEIFLENKEWNRAERYSDRVLNWDPENAQAYLGKFMAEMRISKKEDIATCTQSIKGNKNYQRVLQWGDDELISSITRRTEEIEEHSEEKNQDDNSASVDKVDIVQETKEVLNPQTSPHTQSRKLWLAIGITSFAWIVIVLIAYFCVIKPMGKGKPERPEDKEARALALMEEGKYTEAYQVLEEIGKTNLIVDKRSELAPILLESGNFALAYKLYGIIFNELKPGDTFEFGSYEQDSDLSNGTERIIWIVLEKEQDRVLLVSQKVLEKKPFREQSYNRLTWKGDSLYEWLNTEFINSAFSSNEQGMIRETNNGKVFIPSREEVNEYESIVGTWSCLGTRYVRNGQGEARCNWWLRNINYDDRVQLVTGKGEVITAGYRPGEQVGVRPEIWVKLKYDN